MNFNFFLSLFRDFTLTWDLGLVVFLFFVAFFFGLSLGRKKLVLLLLTIYLGIALIRLVPFMENITRAMSDGQKFAFHVGIFGGMIFLLFLFLSGSAIQSALRIPTREEGPWWHVIFLSFGTVGLLFSSVLAMMPPSYYNKVSLLTQKLFLFHGAQFFWALVGIFILVLLRKGAEK